MAMLWVDAIQQLHPIIRLIYRIITAPSTVRRQTRACREFAQWLETTKGLLKPLIEDPGLMEQQETREFQKQLENALNQAYDLVRKYKDRSYAYRLIMGSDIVEKFRVAQNNIKNYLLLVPLVMLIFNQTMQRCETHCQDKEEDKDGRKETAVLMIVTHCEYDGCPEEIKRSISNYRGVEKVVMMDMDERILGVMVVGDFDAKMLRDYIAKNTKKEVDLVGDGEWERDDHQVLEKTGKDNKSMILPMISATVVLKVGGTGLRCGCQGCKDKIHKELSKIGGVQRVDIDKEKSQVSVTGTGMDTAILQETLGEKVRRPVEVVREEAAVRGGNGEDAVTTNGCVEQGSHPI